MSGLRNLVHGAYKAAAEKVLPPLSKSAFKEKGVSLLALIKWCSVCVRPAQAVAARSH